MKKKFSTIWLALAVAFLAARADVASAQGEQGNGEAEVVLTARGCYSLADTPGELTVRATSPSGLDISELKYCICDESGKVVCRYREKVSDKKVALAVNLPAGRYTLSATDGTRFYGSTPYCVLRRDNLYVKTGSDADKAGALPAAAIREPELSEGPSDWARLWHDIKTKGEERLPARNASRDLKRSLGICLDGQAIECDLSKSGHGTESIDDLIDRTAAAMKFKGQNAFLCPGEWRNGLVDAQDGSRIRVPDFLSAWYVKFDNEGLYVIPTLAPDTMPEPLRKTMSRTIGELVSQGKGHPSFKGVCLRIPPQSKLWSGDEAAALCADVARKLAAARPDLGLWVNGFLPSKLSRDGLDECMRRDPSPCPGGADALRHFVLPLRHGDVLGMSSGGALDGTCGMRDALMPFVQAFRALPAVLFDDAGGTEVVKLRHIDFDGRSWFYVVNTDVKPAQARLSVPKRTRDLVTDERVGGLFSEETLTLRLKPFEMRSFAAPEGRPQLLTAGK